VAGIIPENHYNNPKIHEKPPGNGGKPENLAKLLKKQEKQEHSLPAGVIPGCGAGPE
jgi:hypothetical protein